jgi:membrane-bound lytic murein transglycosylase D
MEPTWDIDVRSYTTHERVEFYVRHFSGDARGRIETWFERGSRYEPMIRATFRAAGIPEDMYYLGLVESGYNPHAYSRAAAVGMWQFMTSTARGMGLRVDWWIDERRDPVKSTKAAARFLDALRDQFGSMYLAAAAYNGGPGRVARGLHRFADQIGEADVDDRFFVLADRRALRSETSNYVPQLIAAALIGKDPSRYGLKIDAVAPFTYDSVIVPAATPLAVVARASGVKVDAIRDLNPQILRGVTPPTGPARVRVPVGTAARFDSAFALVGESDRVAFHRVRTKKGATIASEAKKVGFTVTQLRWYNPKLPKTKSGRLPVGQLLLVPTREVVQAAFNIPDPSVERYGASASVHIVRHGETLSGIAKRYHTTVASLVRLNRLKKHVIYPGQSIIVRGRAKAPVRVASRGALPVSPAAKQGTPPRP